MIRPLYNNIIYCTRYDVFDSALYFICDDDDVHFASKLLFVKCIYTLVFKPVQSELQNEQKLV